MIMKKTLLIFLACALQLFAQSGISNNPSGNRVPSAKTLKQGEFFFSGSFEMVSNRETLSLEGFFTDKEGNQHELNKETPSSTEEFNINFGVRNDLEIGLNATLHYDGDAGNTKLKGFGFGDIGLIIKKRLYENTVINLSTSFATIIPTGTTEKGIRPRHIWYVGNEGKTEAYTADHLTFAGLLYLTAELNENIHFNNYAGYLKTLQNDANIFLWGTSLLVFPEGWVTLLMEVSGETRMRPSQKFSAFVNDALRFSPGLQIHLPKKTELTLGADFGMDFFRKRKVRHGLPVKRNVSDDEIHYTTAGSPPFSISITFSRTFDFDWKDSDGDGIIDRKDFCPGTANNVKVNDRGCPVDKDEDGIMDIFDDCPDTQPGVIVDAYGCPLDQDMDNVPDYQDKCIDTPKGAAVDSTGCLLDSDGDGVDDAHDKCPESANGEKVNEEGCPLDSDNDGVPDIKDSCPNTSAGFKVDEFGCAADTDGDGVPDEKDQCPDSQKDIAQNDIGCPLDSDDDGVPDFLDQCPETPAGVAIDSAGCRIDSDGDGIFDEEDQCAHTMKGATVDSVGCLKDSDGDGVQDVWDKCPHTFKNLAIDKDGCPINKNMDMDNIARKILFHNGSAKLLNSSYTAISDLITIMRQFQINVEIQCSVNPRESDNPQKLSQQRIESIMEYLDMKGFGKDRIKTSAFGDHLPRTGELEKLNPAGVRFIPMN